MFQKQYWFRKLYLGLKVTASFGRSESYTRVVDGQVRCITPDTTSQTLQVSWNVQFITAFVPAWMVPPVYHSIRQGTIKTANQTGEIGVRSFFSVLCLLGFRQVVTYKGGLPLRLQKVYRFQAPKMNPLDIARCCSESNRQISKCENISLYIAKF